MNLIENISTAASSLHNWYLCYEKNGSSYIG